MRVIYPVPTELTKSGGHIQHVLGLCRHASAFGVEVELLCLKSDKKLSESSFKVTEISVSSDSTQKKLFEFSHRVVEELKKSKKPDWIYFRPYPLDYFLLSRHLKEMKVPYAYELNTLWAQELRSQGKPFKAMLYPWLEAKSIRSASALFPVTQEIADYAGAQGAHHVPTLVAGNGIEIPELPSVSREDLRMKWKLPADKKLICMAGFTRPWHGHEKLLEALKNLPEKFHVVLIGSENEQVTKVTLEQAAGYNVKSRVHILPWLSHKDVDEVVFASDIGVSPLGLEKKKMKEAQSLKVRHYLAMGIPVLVAGGEAKEVTESNFIAQLSDTLPSSISMGILQLDGKVFQSEAIREFAKAKLSWRAIAGKTLEFMKSL